MAQRSWIQAYGEKVQSTFDEEGQIRSFDEFLEEVRQTPYALLRTSAQYLRDMLEFYGQEKVVRQGRELVRHKLFDGLASDSQRRRVVGEEAPIDAVYRAVRNAALEGRSDRLILMHGPNGSSKSTIADLLFLGLEDYSSRPEGILYRFSWIFPRGESGSSSLGFRTGSGDRTAKSYANLEPEEIAAVVPSDMNTNPFWLVPREHRTALLEEMLGGLPDWPHAHVPRFELGTKSRAIYEELLRSYRGDWRSVMRHVRVERFTIRRRYRRGAVTIEPQGNVDADARQLMMDTSLANLPASLQNLRLFEVGGDLADANRGLVEYSDFLKRPIELNKYLLTTTERGTIRVPGAVAYLDVVMIGNANEKQLDEFKRQPIFTSFKGRMELVAVPYLLDYEEEVEIYRDQVELIRRNRHVSPHSMRVAALWAILTRLWRPDPANYDEPLKSAVTKLTPLAKALLYQGRDPADLEDISPEDVKTLQDGLPQIADEYTDHIFYEGRFGASPREMKSILLDASYGSRSSCFTPMAVLSELRKLVRDKTLYDFLKLEPKGGYNDPVKFVDDVERALVRLLLREMNGAMELVEEEEYDRRFDRYFQHVIAYTRGTRVTDPVSGIEQEPDPAVLSSVESLLDTGSDIDLFRKELIGKIGAYSVNRPGAPVNYRELFPDILRKLRRDFYGRRQTVVNQARSDFLLYGTAGLDRLTPERQDRVETTMRNLVQSLGYCETCAREMMAFAIKRAPQPDPSE